MRPNIDTIMQAAKAESIPAGEAGLWFIRKLDLPIPLPDPGGALTPPGEYTFLYRTTLATLHQEPSGVVVMEDTPRELRTHLEFMLKARGRVLVTGLGLGCVVRGLLVNPQVAHVTCIERSPSVLKLVRPHMPEGDRLEIIQADALEWAKSNTRRFDYAWHDLWTDPERDEPWLQDWHAKLFDYCAGTVGAQGAWQFPKWAKRRLKRFGKIKVIG